MDNVARQKLSEIVTRYGRAVCDDPKRLRALLTDLCPGLKREAHVLVSAAEHRVAQELQSSNGVPWEVLSGRLARRLQDDLALAEQAAHWAVESWGLALGRVRPEQLVSWAVPAPAAPRPVAPPPLPASAPPPPAPRRVWPGPPPVVHPLPPRQTPPVVVPAQDSSAGPWSSLQVRLAVPVRIAFVGVGGTMFLLAFGSPRDEYIATYITPFLAVLLGLALAAWLFLLLLRVVPRGGSGAGPRGAARPPVPGAWWALDTFAITPTLLTLQLTQDILWAKRDVSNLAWLFALLLLGVLTWNQLRGCLPAGAWRWRWNLVMVWIVAAGVGGCGWFNDWFADLPWLPGAPQLVLRDPRVPVLPFVTVAFSPDGRRLASVATGPSGSAQRTEGLIWDATSGRAQPWFSSAIAGTHVVGKVRFGPGGEQVAVPVGGLVDLWETKKRVEAWGTSAWTKRDTVRGELLAFHPTNSKLAYFPAPASEGTASSDRGVALSDLGTHEKLGIVPGRELGADLVFSPDGRLLAAGATNGEGLLTHIWTRGEGLGSQFLEGTGARGRLTCLAFSRDSAWLAAGFEDKSVVVWDTRVLQPWKTLNGHTRPVTAVAFAADSLHLVSASLGEILVWDRRGPKVVHRFRGGARDLAVSPDGKRLAAAQADAVRIWAMPRVTWQATLPGSPPSSEKQPAPPPAQDSGEKGGKKKDD